MKHCLILGFIFLASTLFSLHAKGRNFHPEAYSPARLNSTITDRKNIEKQVRSELLKWNEMGEFEKQECVEPRLRTQSAIIFDAVCRKTFEELALVNGRHWTKSISRYDADRECFNITFRLGDVVKVVTLKVDIEHAPLFKANFDNLKMEVEQWCFVHGKLYPKSVSFTMDFLENGDKTYSADLTFVDSEQPVVAFDNLGVDNPYLKGRVFNFNDAVKEVKKSHSSDSFEDKVCTTVELMPSFPGGDAALMNWLRANMIYPPMAETNGIQGRVVVSFIVEADGRITNVTVTRPVNPLLDYEAIRLAKSMPRWVPGKRNGIPVRVRYNIPVNFRLVQ